MPALRVVEGAVVSESWTSSSDIEDQLQDPAEVGLVVPGWRTAVAILDDGTIARTIRRAENWTWEDLDDHPDRWIAEELPGYAEEVLRLTGHLLEGSELAAAVMRNVLANRMARIIAVHHRLLYATENHLWDQVARTMGREWLERQRAAVGLDAGQIESCWAAVDLFEMTTREVGHLLSETGQEVIAHALERSRMARWTET